MKAEIIQCADRPRATRHGDKLVIEFGDVGGGKCECEMNITQAWCLAQDINEIVVDYQRPRVHPVFEELLKGVAK